MSRSNFVVGVLTFFVFGKIDCNIPQLACTCDKIRPAPSEKRLPGALVGGVQWGHVREGKGFSHGPLAFAKTGMDMRVLLFLFGQGVSKRPEIKYTLAAGFIFIRTLIFFCFFTYFCSFNHNLHWVLYFQDVLGGISWPLKSLPIVFFLIIIIIFAL